MRSEPQLCLTVFAEMSALIQALIPVPFEWSCMKSSEATAKRLPPRSFVTLLGLNYALWVKSSLRILVSRPVNHFLELAETNHSHQDWNFHPESDIWRSGRTLLFSLLVLLKQTLWPDVSTSQMPRLKCWLFYVPTKGYHRAQIDHSAYTLGFNIRHSAGTR